MINLKVTLLMMSVMLSTMSLVAGIYSITLQGIMFLLAVALYFISKKVKRTSSKKYWHEYI